MRHSLTAYYQILKQFTNLLNLILFIFSDVLTSQNLKTYHKNLVMTFQMGWIAFRILGTNFHLFCPVSFSNPS